MKFQVFKDGKIVDKFTLCGAYLFGTDGIAIRRAEIKSEKGVIECTKPNLETSGLALLWPIKGFGEVLLQTTCLPERQQPYILNVEITRAKLMQIVTKREHWSFFNEIEGFDDIYIEAQALFIKAIQNIHDGPLASKLADESLEKAIVFSEMLAMRHAETHFDSRSKSRGFSRGCLGCQVDPSQINNKSYTDKLLELFGSATIPINWSKMEPSKGQYDFSQIDDCINVLSKKKVVISAGPLLRFSKNYIPKWLLENPVEFEKIREAAYEFVLKIVTNYSGNIRAWRAISGLNAFNYFGFSFEQVLEMTRAANMAVKAADERALKIIEIAHPWGQYYAQIQGTIPPLVYIDMVVQSGINFDAFGLQLHFGRNLSGMHPRDLLQISAVLDYFQAIAKPLYITGVEVPSKSNGQACGKSWNRAEQGKWIEQFYKTALSKPFVNGVTYSSLADSPNNLITDGGLLTDKLKTKESFLVLQKIHKAIFSRSNVTT